MEKTEYILDLLEESKSAAHDSVAAAMKRAIREVNKACRLQTAADYNTEEGKAALVNAYMQSWATLHAADVLALSLWYGMQESATHISEYIASIPDPNNLSVPLNNIIYQLDMLRKTLKDIL